MQDDDALVLGAKPIASQCFKDTVNDKQVYRMAEAGGWPIIRVQNKLAARPSAIRAEIERREKLAVEQRGKNAFVPIPGGRR
jgi:hypothetical protein